MAEDRPIAISSSNHLGPDEILRRTFATTRRGFDPTEVRTFLEEVARELSNATDREKALRAEVAEAEERAANPVLDEETLTSALGTETARVLHAAREAAGQVLRKAEDEASELVERAERRESQARSDTERALVDQASALQAERDEAHRQAQLEVSERIEAARLESEELMERTRAECKSMVQQAQELRTKVLTDLTSRRRVLHLQIEQLRAGRERLSEAIQDVRVSVDHIADDLLRAEDEARLAAEVAGRHAAERPDPDFDQMASEMVHTEPEAGSTEAQASAGETTSNKSAPHGAEATAVVGAVADTEVSVVKVPAVEAPGAEASVAVSEVVDEEGDSSDNLAPASGKEREHEVESLFARLRASGLSESSRPGAQIGQSQSEGEVSEPSSNGSAADGESEAAGESENEPDALAERSSDLVRKDELLRPVMAGLSRRVKRALQDDQNDILDRLRSLGGWKEGVLPDMPEHTARYVEASSQMLKEASRAGVTFVGVSIDKARSTDEVAHKFATELVGPLRRRLEQDCPSVDPTDEAALIEHVGAAFREWRGDRTERLAGDYAIEAFSMSVTAEAPRDKTLNWVVDDEGSPCADCEDNALADDVKPGEAFPTGHQYPPVHSGCRCLLVVSST
ncbi:MAG: DivIVA domain-containing protein [Acidimicrobiales bacterium]